jgi:Zn finger protein HypA/HybF involved in hydrogenase expression
VCENQVADVTLEPFAGVRCAECGRPWLRLDDERSRGYRADIEEEQPEVVFYCPECAQREFKD